MARAKRTTRAEARRRYRAEQGLPDDSLPGEDLEEAEPETSSKGRQTRPAGGQSAPGQPARLGIGTAFRMSFRPLDLRGDLRALPRLAMNKALLIPVLLTIGATAFFLAVRPVASVPGDTLSIIATFLFQYFIQTPAIGGVFIAGFLAPRASWLLGVIVGLVSAVCYGTLILTGALGTSTTVSPTDVLLASAAIAPVMGALFASGAAWYRRFLRLSSPNRGKTRPPEKRGNDGRSRSTSGQKAGARR